MKQQGLWLGFKKIAIKLINGIKILVHFIQLNLQQKHPKRWLRWMLLFVLIVLIVILVSYHITKKHYHLKFDNVVPVQSKNHFIQQATIVSSQSPQAVNQSQLQTALDQLKINDQQQRQALVLALNQMQAKIKSLASQQDLANLQQAIHAPNQKLLGQMQAVKDALQQVVQQTAQKDWVKPGQVTRYFRLVAIQGFSDGLRAIIDVDGNQAALSLHEVCPVCRGWVLDQMNFSHQSAVFMKTLNNHQKLFVKLQAN